MLFGALLIAPASTFVGCSDYDDDISSLQQQIDVNKSTLNDLLAEKVNDIQSQLEALKKADSDLDAAFKDADAALKQAQEAGDKAVLDKVASEYATVAAAKELVANAKDELQKALDSKAEELIAKDAELTEGVSAAKAAAAAAQSTADQALALAQEASDLAQKNADAIKAVNGELDTQAGKLEELAGTLDAQAKKLEDLSSKIDAVKSSLEAQISSLSDEINGKLDEVNGKIAGINGQIAALEAFKTTQEGTNTDLQNQIDALLEELNGVKGYLEGKLRVQIEGMIGDAEARIMESVDANKATIAELKSDYNEQFRLLKERMDKVEAAIGELNDTTIPGINTRIDNLNTDINTLKATLSKVVRSIVYKPELFVNGIESQEYGFMGYALFEPQNRTNAGTMSAVVGTPAFEITDPHAEWDLLPSATNKGYAAPAIPVKYHINPSNATIAYDKLAFVSHDAQVITRASQAAPAFSDTWYDDIDALQPTTYSSNAQAGVLTVGMKVGDAKQLNNLLGKDGSVFALQATVAPDGVEQKITSDYAQIYATEITPEAIAFNSNEYKAYNTYVSGVVDATGNDELYKGAVQALSNPSSMKIEYTQYTDAKGIDLKKLFEMHYSWDTQTPNQTDHKALAYGAEVKFGLKYDFQLINLAVGANRTNDSKYANITNGVLTTRVIDGDKSVVPGSESAARAAIGRHPLVRVRITDTAGNVVLVGFFHVQIVERINNVTTKTYAFDPVQFTCATKVERTNWEYTSEQILQGIGMSREDFNNNYEIVRNNDVDNIAIQHYADGSVASSEHVFGEIKLENDVISGTVTPVLKWTFTNGGADLQKVYDDNANHSITTYVKFVRKNANDNSLEGYILVPLKYTVTKPKAPGVGTKQTNANGEYINWDANGAFLFNVGQPVRNHKITDYKTAIQNQGRNLIMWTDLDFGWVNQAPTWELQGGYYNSDRPYKYFFVPEKDKTFTSVWKYNGEDVTIPGKRQFNVTYRSIDGSKTYPLDGKMPSSLEELKDNKGLAYKYNEGVFNCAAIYDENNVWVCRIDQSNGAIEWNTDNDVAKGILNTDANNFVKVGIVTNHDNTCNIALPLAMNNSLAIYDVKVQRPLNLTTSGTGQITDGDPDKSEVKLGNFLSFTDWRNVSLNANPWLFYFYEVKAVTVDIDNITTNVNGGKLGKTKLSDAKPEIIITRVPSNFTGLSATSSLAQIKNMMGSIKYENTGASVANGYDILVPVYVTYALSGQAGGTPSVDDKDFTVHGYVEVHINSSYQ